MLLANRSLNNLEGKPVIIYMILSFAKFDNSDHLSNLPNKEESLNPYLKILTILQETRSIKLNIPKVIKGINTNFIFFVLNNNTKRMSMKALNIINLLNVR